MEFTHLSQHPAQEVVMSGKGVAHEHVSSGVGVQQALIGRLEEPLVGVEPRLQELIEELPENAAAINASFV